MANTARQGSGGESFSHFNAIRMRLVGFGNLLMKLYGLDDETSEELASFQMKKSSHLEPNIICNMIEQRIALEGKVTNINEHFRINRIIIFSRIVFTDIPG